VRVLGAGATGAADLILGAPSGDRVGPSVISLSLSTTKRRFAEDLHELADLAYFNRTILVASAQPSVDSYPWRFSSVISVGSHEERDPFIWYANPDPPVEPCARRRRRGRVARRRNAALHREQLRGAAHRGRRRARPRKAPRADAVQPKSVLHLTATNTEVPR
jgi:hypothetical protein